MTVPKDYDFGPEQFGGHTITADFESLPGEAEAVLGDFVRTDRIGMAQAAALHVACTKIESDGRVIFRNTARGARRAQSLQGINQLPSPREYYDKERKMSLVRRLTFEVVKNEAWLLDVFEEAFEEFAEDPVTGEAAPANPTESQPAQKIRTAS